MSDRCSQVDMEWVFFQCTMEGRQLVCHHCVQVGAQWVSDRCSQVDMEWVFRQCTTAGKELMSVLLRRFLQKHTSKMCWNLLYYT